MNAVEVRSRDDEDTAAVLVVLVALAGSADGQPETPAAQSIWADPVHRLGGRPAPSATGWWASGMPG